MSMAKASVLREHAFGLFHPRWPEPTNFFYGTAEEAWGAIERVYGPEAQHIVVERTYRAIPNPSHNAIEA